MKNLKLLVMFVFSVILFIVMTFSLQLVIDYNDTKSRKMSLWRLLLCSSLIGLYFFPVLDSVIYVNGSEFPFFNGVITVVVTMSLGLVGGLFVRLALLVCAWLMGKDFSEILRYLSGSDNN